MSSKPTPPLFAIDAVRTLLTSIGADPNREGLLDTPRRVFQALAEMTAGEHEDPADHLQVNFDGGAYDEVIALAGIPFTSVCEHHLLPFTGLASVCYLPGEVLEVPNYALREPGERSTIPLNLVPSGKYRVVGLSKLARVVDVYARRLQMQEQMTVQIADALDTHLKPRGVGVLVEAAHSCMSCRGVNKTGSIMRTSVLRGAFRSNDGARAEAMEKMRMPR